MERGGGMFWQDEITLTEAAQLLDVSEDDVLRLIQKQLLSARWEISDSGQRVRLIHRELVLGLKDSGKYRSVLSEAASAGAPGGTGAVLTAPVSYVPSTAGGRVEETAGRAGSTAGANEPPPRDNTLALQVLAQSMDTLRELVVALAGQDEQQNREVLQRVAQLNERLAADQAGQQQHIEGVRNEVVRLRGEITEANATLAGMADQLGQLVDAVNAINQYLREQEQKPLLAQIGKFVKDRKPK